MNTPHDDQAINLIADSIVKRVIIKLADEDLSKCTSKSKKKTKKPKKKKEKKTWSMPKFLSVSRRHKEESVDVLSVSVRSKVGTAAFFDEMTSALEAHRGSICIKDNIETFRENDKGQLQGLIPLESDDIETLREKRNSQVLQDLIPIGKDIKISIKNDDKNFESAFSPDEMRCLALVSHNGMKSTMRDFVQQHKHILKHFRLTGTNSTMSMLREVLKDEQGVIFGPTCSSGPLGGDAELVALMVTGKLGGIIFFQDPMTAHPHQADIDCLNRQAHVHNTIIAGTPTTALALMHVFKMTIEGEGRPELLPSFFFSLQSPTVAPFELSEMVKEQEEYLSRNLLSDTTGSSTGSNLTSSFSTLAL